MYIFLFINSLEVIKQLNLVKDNPNHILIVEFINAFNGLDSFELFIWIVEYFD